jgi:hypothetical protein
MLALVWTDQQDNAGHTTPTRKQSNGIARVVNHLEVGFPGLVKQLIVQGSRT